MHFRLKRSDTTVDGFKLGEFTGIVEWLECGAS